MGNDLRKYASETNRRVILWALVLLLTIGPGLVWLLYGARSALTSLLCLLGVFAPVGLIWLVLAIIDAIVKRADRE